MKKIMRSIVVMLAGSCLGLGSCLQTATDRLDCELNEGGISCQGGFSLPIPGSDD